MYRDQQHEKQHKQSPPYCHSLSHPSSNLRARGKERKLAWQGLCVLATFCQGVTGGGCVCVGDVLVLVMLMMLMMLMMTMLI